MTEAERIERAAEALCKSMHGNPGYKSEYYSEHARAAITAYLGGDVVVPREPTSPFREGDRVHHGGRTEDGTVTSVANGVVTVEFDIRTSRGNISVGAYDELWFQLNQNLLIRLPAEMEG